MASLAAIAWSVLRHPLQFSRVVRYRFLAGRAGISLDDLTAEQREALIEAVAHGRPPPPRFERPGSD